MAIKRRKFIEGIRLKGSTNVTGLEGEIRLDPSALKFKAYVDGAERSIVTEDQTQTLENKTIDATAATGNNTLSADSADIVYNDTTQPVSSLGTDVQSALDAVKVALDNQNEASEITYNPAGNPETIATDIQQALDDTGTASQAAQQAIDDHIADVADAHTASAITNVPSGNLAATDVQSALNELQGDIDTTNSNKMDANNPSASGVMDYQVQNFTGTGSVLLNPNESIVSISGAVTEITGLTPTTFTTNERITIINVSGDDIVIKEDTVPFDGTGIRTGTGKDLKLKANASIILQYNEHDSFWHLVGGSGAGGGATQFEIVQVAHGFAVGNGIYHNGTTWIKAQANNVDTLAYHVVVEVPDVNTFVAADFGRIEIPSHGYTIGEYYFLSDLVAGEATITESSTFSNPLFYVESVDFLHIKCLRPEAVGADTSMDQLSDVSASLPNNGDILVYNSISGLYELESRDLVQTQAINNNASVAVNLTNLNLDGATYKGYKVTYSIYRSTDTNEVSQTGTLHFAYKPTAGTWSFSDSYAGDDSGTTFEVDGTGQAKYTSTDLPGTSYSGTINYRIQEKL